MKRLISVMTVVAALSVGIAFTGEAWAGPGIGDNVKNGITYVSAGAAAFDDFAIGTAAEVEEGSSCMGGSSAGGSTAGISGRRNGITYFSTSAAAFDAGPTGPDIAGSCVNSAPRKMSVGQWPGDFS